MKLIILICLCALMHGVHAHEKMRALEECIENCWSVDSHTCKFIVKYFAPLLENPDKHFIIDDFIAISSKFDIQFPLDKSLQLLPEDDGVIKATKFHPVVFENPYVRILVGNAEPGEREPFHSHCWKSVLVSFQDTTYKIEYPNGTSELLVLPAGAYLLSPETPYACTNLGPLKENCLRFEVK